MSTAQRHSGPRARLAGPGRAGLAGGRRRARRPDGAAERRSRLRRARRRRPPGARRGRPCGRRRVPLLGALLHAPRGARRRPCGLRAAAGREPGDRPRGSRLHHQRPGAGCGHGGAHRPAGRARRPAGAPPASLRARRAGGRPRAHHAPGAPPARPRVRAGAQGGRGGARRCRRVDVRERRASGARALGSAGLCRLPRRPCATSTALGLWLTFCPSSSLSRA